MTTQSRSLLRIPSFGPARSDSRDDVELIDLSRGGDHEAFTTLFYRHHDAAVRSARSTTRRLDPEDLAAEAFARIWRALQAGGGPTSSFKPYLHTTIRNLAATWGARQLEDPTGLDLLEVESAKDPRSDIGFEDAMAEHDLVASAFATLPKRWRSVLWQVDVEGRPTAEVAGDLGLTPNGTSALTKRAREALSRAWLQAQVDEISERPECQWTLDHIGGYARRSLTKVQRTRLQAHLDTCDTCSRAARRVSRLASSLRLIVVLASGSAAALVALGVLAPTPAVAASQAPKPRAHSAGHRVARFLTNPAGAVTTVAVAAATTVAVAASGLIGGAADVALATPSSPVAAPPSQVAAPYSPASPSPTAAPTSISTTSSSEAKPSTTTARVSSAPSSAAPISASKPSRSLVLQPAAPDQSTTPSATTAPKAGEPSKTAAPKPSVTQPAASATVSSPTPSPTAAPTPTPTATKSALTTEPSPTPDPSESVVPTTPEATLTEPTPSEPSTSETPKESTSPRPTPTNTCRWWQVGFRDCRPHR